LHQNVVILELVYLVKDDQDDIVELVENLPEPLVIGRRRDALVRDLDLGFRERIERIRDCLNSLCFRRILRTIDIGKLRVDPFVVGSIDEAFGDVFCTE